MALPAQAVEKLIQEPTSSQGAYKQLLVLSSSLFVLMVVLYAGLTFGYTTYLQSESAKLDAKIQEFGKTTPLDQQQAVANFYSQLINLRTLLGNHTVTSPVLDMIEKTSSPDIYYTKLNLNTATNEVDLTGTARTLDAAAAEAAVLQTTAGVTRINFTNAGQQQSQSGIGTGGWQFNISVFLDSSVLKNTGATLTAGGSAPSAITPPATATSTATSTIPAATTTKK